MGRKNCTKCKCWRPVSDFSVQQWDDPIERNTFKVLRPTCNPCERIKGRVKNARLNGRSEPYGRRDFYTRLSPEERRERHRLRHKERMETEPEYARKFRERQRMYAEAKRREAGKPVRLVVIESRKSQVAVRHDPKLAIEPFQQWIRKRAAKYAKDFSLHSIDNDKVSGLGHLALACHVSEKRLYQILKGDEYPDGVPLKTVDDALTNEGSTFLFELYPEEDEQLAA